MEKPPKEEQAEAILTGHAVDYIRTKYGFSDASKRQLATIIFEDIFNITIDEIYTYARIHGLKPMTKRYYLNHGYCHEDFSIYKNTENRWIFSFSERGKERDVFGVYDELEDAERAFIELIYRSFESHIKSLLSVIKRDFPNQK
jgi:hypothetical protein